MKKLILTLAALTTVLAAHATGTTRAASYQLTANRDVAERNFRETLFSAVARIGDSAVCAPCPKEQGLGPTTGNYTQWRNNDFKNGQSKSFEINYNASNRKVTYKLSGQVLEYTIAAGRSLDALLVRAKSANCSRVNIDCLVFKNDNLGAGLRPDVQNGGSEYLRITNGNLNRDWTLKGSVVMSWQGKPKCNDMLMEVKGVEAVPEPATILAVATGLSALAARRRKKSV